MTSRLIGLLLWTSVSIPLAAEAEPWAWRIYSGESAVYQVLYEQLAEAGLPGGEIDSETLRLENQGEPVRLWVEDGGDGVFGPGDSIEYVGDVLPGASAHFHEYSPTNVYRLSVGGAAGPRMTPAIDSPEGVNGGTTRGLWRRRHLEVDKLLARLAGSKFSAGGPEEPWFWAKLAHNRKPWSLKLDLSDVDGNSDDKVLLRVHFRALSQHRPKTVGVPDHRVEISLDGTPLAVAEWDGKTPYLLESPGLPASLFAGKRRLRLRVPERPAARGSNPIVDVVMLNWIEIDYPRRSEVEEPVRLHLEDGSGPANIELRSPARRLTAYGDRGSRITMSGAAAGGEPPSDSARRFQLKPRLEEASYHVVPDAQFASPDRIEPDRPSDLRSARHADYLMISHRRLIEAIQPLADFHRQRGLKVSVIDVQDVYDEFNHGILDPRAIRDFLAFAYQEWQRPAPRFVLLVGDASWDTKNSTVDDANYANWADRNLTAGARFTRKSGTPYDEAPELNARQLIPTWNYSTYQGHAASDNQFVAVGSDGYLPVMAIGRLPVATPEEVTRIVAKTVRYASRPEVGPWRRSALFITNESRSFQNQSDALAMRLAGGGMSSQKVYPASTEKSNEHHTRRLIEILNEGQLLVHFLGHGGRYIWRTGPPDFDKNHDLFTLDHLDELEPSPRLPVVLSLTCFSAPFDHPNADSIGEKLLRLADRGAVAVFGASWRNTPSPRWGTVLLEEMTAPDATVGEAVMRAKQAITNRMFVETYNLLGDPAVSVALPVGAIELSGGEIGSSDLPLSVRGVVDLEDFSGRIVVDLVDARGEAVSTRSFETASPEFVVELDVTAEELASARLLRAYAWDASRGVDALGAMELAQGQSESG